MYAERTLLGLRPQPKGSWALFVSASCLSRHDANRRASSSINPSCGHRRAAGNSEVPMFWRPMRRQAYRPWWTGKAAQEHGAGGLAERLIARMLGGILFLEHANDGDLPW
jgi:hypothetical protein